MFGSNIKYIMEKVSEKRKKHLSVQELSEISGISDTTIVKMRKNSLIGECRLNTLKKVADALGCKTKDLYSED